MAWPIIQDRYKACCMTLDPRLTPARPDLAAAHLRGQVEAARFVQGEPASLAVASAPLRGGRSGAAWETEALYGEAATVYEQRDGWAWVQLERDGYVGYLEAAALGAPTTPTHRVAALAHPRLSRPQHQAAACPRALARRLRANRR